MSLPYPDEPIDEDFPRPPHQFTDKEGHSIEIERATENVESLVEMYETFASEDRAQGIPPSGEERIREWLDVVMKDRALNVVAWHDQKAVGHAMLVADKDESYELAIFVQQEYQKAGIGTALMKTVLGAAQERGIERIWLSVERWNRAAIALYEKVGFERVDNTSFEIEMTIRLAPEE